MIATLWAHLPNAVYIDRVVASAKANPDHWQKSWAMAEWEARPGYTLRKAVWDMIYSQGRSVEWLALHTAVRAAAWESMYDTLLALIAFDDCAYMLDSDPGELAVLAKFGDRRAILLLSACKVFSQLNI